jgi:hypothetical protein
MRFRLRPLVTIAPKVSPDPAAAAELARRRSQINFKPAHGLGFLIDEVKKPGPRFDPAPAVENTKEIVCITDEAVIAELLASDAPLVIPLCTSDGNGEPVQAPAQDRDWSKYDEPTIYRLGFPDPLRHSTADLLYPLPSLLRRQAG